MDELKKFYAGLIQDIETIQQSSEEGETQEQIFTRIAMDILTEAGEVDNPDAAYDERNIGRAGQLKINGYSLSENYETADLFITIFKYDDQIVDIHKKDVDQAATRITNFFRRATYDDYAEEIAESSPIFEFAHTLATYEDLQNSLVRVNAIILTDGAYKGDIPQNTEINGYKVYYRVIDINYLYQISEASRMPISFNFKEQHYKIPCVTCNTGNTDYNAYIAILPGTFLSDIYEQYGNRLLEQNVRCFLQFGGKINQGIKKTIKTEPHMFLAYNNGISATADDIELDKSGRYIESIHNLQIVNGGQTTASIYYTAKKDKVDVSDIYVQAKISVIHKKEQFNDIVSNISRFANTQNKVEEADFSSNNPSLIEFERASRYILTPISDERNYQTYWFFERSRASYKAFRNKEGFTPSRIKAFDLKYPKDQVVDKSELAKAENGYREVKDGSKILIGPHTVVKGKTKNHASYIAHCLPKPEKINNIYYEDAIAKIILFRTINWLYGDKRRKNSMGELKQVVIPYTMSLLYELTDGRLNLYKIWKNQCLSERLQYELKPLMAQIQDFILTNSPTTHYIEWAKKEECWIEIKDHEWYFDVDSIESDLIDPENPPKRHVIQKGDSQDDEEKHIESILRSIPYKLWEKIAEWGEDSKYLKSQLQTRARDIAHTIRFNKKFTANQIHSGKIIFDIVCDKNIELLQEADSIVEESHESQIKDGKVSSAADIDLEIIKDMILWEQEHHTIAKWKYEAMIKALSGVLPLTPKLQYGFFLNLKAMRLKGYDK